MTQSFQKKKEQISTVQLEMARSKAKAIKETNIETKKRSHKQWAPYHRRLDGFRRLAAEMPGTDGKEDFF